MKPLPLIAFVLLLTAHSTAQAQYEDYENYLQAQQEAFDAEQNALLARTAALWRCIGNGVAPGTVAAWTAGQNRYDAGWEREVQAQAAANQQNWILAALQYGWAKNEYNNAKTIWDSIFPN